MADGQAQAPAPNSPAPPQGPTGVSSPVPNRGLEAAGLAELALAVRQLEQVGAKFPISSEIGRAVREAALKLSKHVPEGTASPGIQQNAMQQMLQKLRQQAPMMAALRGAQGGAGGSPAAATTPPPTAAAA